MVTLALVIGIVWGVSVVLVAIAGTFVCCEEVLEAKLARLRASRRSSRPAPPRHLEPDTGLLVPWSAVRRSTRRLRAERSARGAETDDARVAVVGPTDRQRCDTDSTRHLSKAV